jgi:asparagine synthetase B (glutamine-hydrolysing)
VISCFFTEFQRVNLCHYVTELNGIFGFVCVGNDGEDVIAARDHCGIKPLYIGYGKGGSVWFASELKVGLYKLNPVSS